MARSAAAAFAWEFRRRHRWGWIAVGGYVAALAVVRLVLHAKGSTPSFDDAESFSAAVIVPMAITFMYLLAVFTFGLDGDLAARRSMYPPRLFTLPVTSAELAGWPMLYGTVAMGLLWLAARLLAVWPSGMQVPAVWPALLAAGILAWAQALTWMPYALPGMRVVVSVLLLVTIDVVVILAVHFGATEATMAALLLPLLPAAWWTACRAVTRARRGDEPDWRGLFTRAGEDREASPPPRRHFSSPARAQLWFEWRRFGRSLPVLVGILAPCELLLLFAFSETPSVVRATLLAVLLTPPFMAAFVAATVSRSSADASDAWELTPYMASRPLTSAQLVAARLVAAIGSTLAAWLLVAAVVPAALWLSGAASVAVADARRAVEFLGPFRAGVFALVALSAFAVATWKRLVQSLFVGMSGRAWLVKASVFASLALLTLFSVAAPWALQRRDVIAEILGALPRILVVLVGCKMLAAAWVVARLHASRLVCDRTLILGALLWDAAVLASFGVLVWLAPAVLFRVSALALVAILAIPLVRVSASPLALARNRHR